MIITLKNFSAFLLAVFILSSCSNIGEQAEKKLKELQDKTASLDSLLNNQLDRVATLDSIINTEGVKVKKIDSLINTTSSKLDSIAKDKAKMLE